MNLWRWLRRNVRSDVDKTVESLEAEVALQSAHEKLEATKAQGPKVASLARSLEQVIKTNEFRARMEEAFRGGSN